MQHPPPRTQRAKAEAPESQPPPETATETPTMVRFEALARRLLRVSPSEIAEKNQIWKDKRGL